MRNNTVHKGFVMAAVVVVTFVGLLAQSPARQQLARGNALWDQRLANSAIAALEAAARDRGTASEAYEALGRLYTFKGWLQDNVFPGWHDEPEYRERALAALKASLAADRRARPHRKRCAWPKVSPRPTRSIPRRPGRR